MISNLPNIINIERKSKVGSPKSLYVSVGPITPMPGPILARHEREVDIPSIKVRPGSKYKVTKEPIKKRIMKIKKKTPTLRKRFSSRTLSPILSLMMARGYAVEIIEPEIVDEYRRKNKLNQLNREAFERLISKLNPMVAYVDAADVNEDRFGNEIKKGLTNQNDTDIGICCFGRIGFNG